METKDTYAVFLRGPGSKNALHAPGDCVWVGEAWGPEHAKRIAYEIEGVNVLNGQHLDARRPCEFRDPDQDLALLWRPFPKAY